MINTLATLYAQPRSIITTRDIALLLRETNPDHLKSKIAYYVKTGALVRITQGVFAKNTNYQPRELAAKIYHPSYISFETALRDAGIIFQHYETIHLAGPFSKTIHLDGHNLEFHKLKNEILYNPEGILSKNNYHIASPERAFLDTLYLHKDFYFDNLNFIDWNRCFELVGLYGNKQLVKRLKQYQKTYAQ